MHHLHVKWQCFRQCWQYLKMFLLLDIDLGANVGMFTLAVAAMGRKVKAVDAGFVNHAYMR
jgi:2-polyprenyl-3-methyl-5-hydroxy-6-metoxy-1,4-benzoquinol methylase